MNDEFQKRINESGGNKLILKSGDSKKGVFRGELFEFKCDWENKKPIVYDKRDPRGKTRFRWNFVIRGEDAKLQSKIFEFGIGLYNDICDIAAEYKIRETVVKISRVGSTIQDTEWKILALSDKPSMPELERVELQVLNDVEKSSKNPTSEFDNEPWPDIQNLEEPPF